MSPDTAEMAALPGQTAVSAEALIGGVSAAALPEIGLPLSRELSTAAVGVGAPPAQSAAVAPEAPPRAGLQGELSTRARELRARRARVWEWWRALRLTEAQSQALRDAMAVLIGSRALVWIAGVATVLMFGFGPTRSAYHPPGLTGGFGGLGDVLAAPAARWDGAWYLTIAHYGYLPELGPFTAARAAFFPLYPLLIWAVSLVGLAGALAGVIVSIAALLVALYALHRLTTLELAAGHLVSSVTVRAGELARGREIARLALVLCAFGPMAFFLSADYSESLYLALSIGVFLQARRGRWMWVGVLGGLAAATRSTGVLLILPALALYLYGPREERAQRHARRQGWMPRYAVRTDVLWLLLIPAGLISFMAWMWLSGGEPGAPFHAQALWGRQFAGPFVAIWDATRAAFEGARQLISGQSAHLYFPLEGHSPFIEAGHNIMLFVFLALAVSLTIGVIRRLPAAYGLYILAALALPLSYPVATQPLMSLPRFLLVLFPLNMWLASYLAERRRLRIGVLVLCGGALVFFTAQFATWHWVA